MKKEVEERGEGEGGSKVLRRGKEVAKEGGKSTWRRYDGVEERTLSRLCGT